MSSLAAPLLTQLDVLHKNIVFPGAFERLTWSMVAAYECEVSRKKGKIHLETTTFWVTPDKNPDGAMKIDFADSSEAMGAHITEEAFTNATQTQDDVSIVIGFAQNEAQAMAAQEQHQKFGGRPILVDHITDNAPVKKERMASSRAARRPRRR